MRKDVDTKNNVKEEQLEEAFVLWSYESKNKETYLSGKASENTAIKDTKLVAFYNTNKKNPKEADIRVYTLDKDGKVDKEIASLWDTITKNNKKILTGVGDNNERLVGFYRKEEDNEKRPLIRVYFQKD